METFLDVCTLGPNSLLHLLYVCHSVSWLTSLLKLNKFRDILGSWRAICLKSVWRHSGDVNIYATNDSECHVCMAVCLFAYFFTKISQRHISGSGRDILFWKFWRHSWYVGTLVPINSEFTCVSVSFCSWHISYWNVTKLEISPVLDELFVWKVFEDILGMLIYMLQMILNVMYVCQSVCLLTFLPKLDRGISLVLEEIFCFGIFWRYPDMLVH